MICADCTSDNYPKGGNGLYGDSGGPLQCLYSDGTWSLAGVDSWGGGIICSKAKKPGVYTNVASVFHWIKSKIEGMLHYPYVEYMVLV